MKMHLMMSVLLAFLAEIPQINGGQHPSAEVLANGHLHAHHHHGDVAHESDKKIVANSEVVHRNDDKIVDNGIPSVKTQQIEEGEDGKEKLDMRILIADTMDWANKVGFVMRTKEHPDRSDYTQVGPFTLYPSPVPRRLFFEAQAVQEALSLLYFRVASNHEFLMRALGEVAKGDETIRRLLTIVEEVHRDGVVRQPISLMPIRADYMIHVNDDEGNKENGFNDVSDDQKYELKQIEVNIGAVGGFLAECVTPIHQRVLAKSGRSAKFIKKRLPSNNIYHTMAEGIFLAWQKFGNPKAIVLMVVPQLGGPVNRELDYRMEELSGGKMVVVEQTLPECIEKLKLGKDNELLLESLEIAVVNYRLARTIHPKFITDEKLRLWLMVERSTAIKSPSITLDLASTKKVQQVLAQPGEVERFFPDPEDADKVAAIRATYAGLWSLDESNEKSKQIMQDAIVHPERYVLKPNRDGGGYNYWDEEIPQMLNKMTPDERTGFILMQRLNPFVTQNYLMKLLTEPQVQDVVTELSIFGFLLGNQVDGTVDANRVGGHMMRTKPEHVREGGTSRGNGFYDSPYLF